MKNVIKTLFVVSGIPAVIFLLLLAYVFIRAFTIIGIKRLYEKKTYKYNQDTSPYHQITKAFYHRLSKNYRFLAY